MFKENIVMLRNLRGFSQEDVAEKIGISRQAYAKWERGETVPDIEKCQELARLYNTTLDMLTKESEAAPGVAVPPSEPGKHIFGTVTMNDKGQIVIPKKARDIFKFGTGDELLILGDEASNGLAIMKLSVFEDKMRKTMEQAHKKQNPEN